MLHDIATSAAIDWKVPAANIKSAIEDIFEINAFKLSPIVEQMKRDPDDQKIYGEPLTGLTAQQTSYASQRVPDAIARLEKITPKGNYSLFDMISTELDDLWQDLDWYGHKPQWLHEAFFDCYVDLQHPIDAGELAADDKLSPFCRQLERSVTNILASDPCVRATVEQLASVRFDRLGSEGRLKLPNLTAAAIAEAKPELSVALTENLKDANAETVSFKARDKGRYSHWSLD